MQVLHQAKEAYQRGREHTFPFLQLRGEVRNSIYKLAIPHEERFGPSYRQVSPHPDISLLSKSVRLCAEARGILYSTGTLSVDLIDSESYTACLKWMDNTEEGLISSIRKIEITGYVGVFRRRPCVAFQKCRFDIDFMPEFSGYNFDVVSYEHQYYDPKCFRHQYSPITYWDMCDSVERVLKRLKEGPRVGG